MATEPRKSNGVFQRRISEDQSETGKKRVLGQQLSPRLNAQWKATFYENVQLKALNFQEVKIQNLQKKKRQEIKLEKKEPPDSLSKEWFNTEEITLETRAYLLDKLLPTLVPGVEKLLKVAEKKMVLETTEDDESDLKLKFDPINFLGEYLMRHNPGFDVSATPNPYMRGMKVVKDELKARVPETTMHKLEEMKHLVKEKRHHREEVEDIKAQVAKMRKEALGVQFQEWTQDANESMPLALVQSALTSFLQVVTTAPPDAGEEIYDRPLEGVGTLDVKVNEEEFAEYVHSYIKNFTSDMFAELLKHFLQCSNDARDLIRHDIWRQMFVQLFFDCDYGKVGFLDRPRILSLLEAFYDDYSELAKGFRDPRKWPVIELDDIDLTVFWGSMEDDEPIDRSVYLAPPVLELSEEALALNVILKSILSDPDQAAAIQPEESNIQPELAANSEEEAALEQPFSSTGEESETVPATEQAEEIDQAEKPATDPGVNGLETEIPTAEPGPNGLETEIPAAEPGPNGLETEIPAAEPGPNALQVQEDQDPTVLTEEGAAEEAAREELVPETSEEPVPEAVPAEPAEVTSEVKEADEKEEQKSPDADFAASLEQAMKELTSDQPIGSEEHVAAAKASEAELASNLEDKIAGKEMDTEQSQEEAGVKAESGSMEQIVKTTEVLSATKSEDQIPDLSTPTPKASEVSQKGPQMVYGKPWSGDLPTVDLSFKYTDYGKEIRDDWNQEDSRFPELRMNMLELQTLGPPFCTSAFNKSSLNLPQFVQLMETFVGEEPTFSHLKSLTVFVRDRYVQTEKEKIDQLESAHHSTFLARQQLLLAALFEKWDNECSGFLSMEEVDAILCTFKEGMEEEALNKAKLQLPVPQWHPSGVVKLTPKDFQTYIELVVSELTGSEEVVLDNVVEFLMSAVEQNHIEQLRGSARRRWLRGIQHIAKTNGRCMEPVYQAVFRTLCRDADAHGEGKRLSAYIALLEFNTLFPERGDVLLRYVACTEDDAPYLLNKILYMDMKGVSFAAALNNKPVHVPRVHLHGNIHFWNESRLEEERKGSFLVIPLEDIRRRVFGILGLDTLRDSNKKTIFVPHEIRFYQGVANTFSIAYHYIRTQENIMQVIITAVGWLSVRTPNLHSITIYFMEPGEERMQDYTLRKVMTSERTKDTEFYPLGPVLSRKDNIFRNYLFKCIDCAEVVTVCVYEEYHIVVPLRNSDGQAIALFDLNLGPNQKLPPYEHKDLQKALKMVQGATCEILKEDAGDLDPYYVLEAEYVGDWRRGGVLFYRFMLQDLQNCIWNLDPWLSFEEIRGYDRPPRFLHKILKSMLLILYPKWASTEEADKWKNCIQKIDGDFIENICYFDPTAAYVKVKPEDIQSYLKGVERRDVWKFGLAPIEYFYNWTVTCLALIELAKKLQRDQSISARSLVVHKPVPQPSGTSNNSSKITRRNTTF